MASLSCPADDELLCGAGAVLIPLLDEEFALGPPTRQVRPDRVWPFGAGPRIRAPDGEVPGPDGVTGSAEEPDVLRVRGMHAFFTPPSTPFFRFSTLLVARSGRNSSRFPNRFHVVTHRMA